MSEFSGLVAVVTGAGSGIGLAVSRLLTQAGAKVFGIDVNQGELGTSGTFIKCDISDSASVTAAFQEIRAATPVIDILANIAGIGAIGTVEDATDAEWQKVLQVNVVGASRVSAAAIPLLRKSKSPAIVNVCSIAAIAGFPKRAVYSASKGALLSLTLAMAADHVKEGIRVNAVNPSTTETPWIDRLLSKADDPKAERANLEARQPMGRLVSPVEVAHAVLYLASPNQASTTGSIVSVDGGTEGLRLPK